MTICRTCHDPDAAHTAPTCTTCHDEAHAGTLTAGAGASTPAAVVGTANWVPESMPAAWALSLLGSNKLGYALREVMLRSDGPEHDVLAGILRTVLPAVGMAEAVHSPVGEVVQELGTHTLTASALAQAAPPPPPAPVARPTPPPPPRRQGDPWIAAAIGNLDNLNAKGDPVRTANAARDLLEFAERAEAKYFSDGFDAIAAELGRPITAAAMPTPPAMPTTPPPTKLDMTGLPPEFAHAVAAMVQAMKANRPDQAMGAVPGIQRALRHERIFARHARDRAAETTG